MYASMRSRWVLTVLGSRPTRDGQMLIHSRSVSPAWREMLLLSAATIPSVARRAAAWVGCVPARRLRLSPSR
jgi:hypothetical protein